MTVRTLIKPSTYFDSVVLMRVAADLNQLPGVAMASLNMATPANLEVLNDAGLLTDEARSAGPNDLVVSIDAEDDVLDDTLAAAEDALAQGLDAGDSGGGGEPIAVRTLHQAGDANLALISTPGAYAGAEAMKALRHGMNVFMFSDNVPLDTEIALKNEAHERGLIVMGPDCGTSIVGGVPLGFANVVRAGDIGLIGASGTGLQEVSTLIDNWGSGLSHAIGVGSHDLSKEVEAISMHDAIDALAADPSTRVIGLISKPPDPQIAASVLDHAAQSGKPVVAAFLGASTENAPEGVTIVPTLEGAAARLVETATGTAPTPEPDDEVPAAVHGERRLLRALFAGGTFAFEAALLLEPQIGTIVEDATPRGADHSASLPDEHLVLDLGSERFTVGRAHPMIDPTVRVEMLQAAGRDPRTAIILLDVVLGYMADDDPAGSLAPAIAEITGQQDAPIVLAFVTGTDSDPQARAQQKQKLRDAGAYIAGSSTSAVAIVASSLK